MERHRTASGCASCHRRMDPLGFGLENFDAVGGRRTHEAGSPIDPCGTLPGSGSFKGPAELRALLESRREAFSRCLAEKMLTYALGRGLQRADRRAVDQIIARLARDGYRFSALLLACRRRKARRSRRAEQGGRGHEATDSDLAAHTSLGRLRGRGAAAAGGHESTEGRRLGRPEPRLGLAFLYVPNGVHMPDWTPKEVGESFALPPVLEPLRTFRDDVLVLSGLTLDPARAHGDGGGDHARAMASFLTGRHPRKSDGADLHAGISIDQVAARAVGRSTRIPSLEIGCEGGKNAGECDHGYSCAYQSNLSWRSESTPVAKEINPRLVFDRFFGGPAGGGADDPRRASPQEHRRPGPRGCPTAQRNARRH